MQRALILGCLLGCTGRIDPAAETDPPAVDGGDPATTDDRPDAATAAVSDCAVPVTIGGHLAWAHFSNPMDPCAPSDSEGRDTNILDELVRLIADTPAGETIRGNIKSLSVESIPDALLAAEQRGVTVYITADSMVKNSTDGAVDRLDQLANRRYCPYNTGCISSVYGGIAHSKLFTFSRTRDPGGAERSEVAWFGSSNLTWGADGTDGFNDAVTVYGDPELYASLLGYLEHMYRGTPRYSDFYDAESGRGYYKADSATVYASPEPSKDIAVDRLNDVTPDDSCEVRVMNAWLTAARARVTDQLIAMKRGGCSVEVITLHLDDSQFNKLHGAGITVKKAHASTKIHDKVVTLVGMIDGVRVYRVFTGSHNFNADGLTNSDEIFVKMARESEDSHPLYDAFVTHFHHAWDTGVTLDGGTE